MGRRVVPTLLERGHEVTAVGRAADRLGDLSRRGAATCTVDIFDRDAVERAMDGHDAVINLATHVPAASRMFLPGAWKEMDHVRRDGSATLARAALAVGARRFIQESFAPIYPDHGDQWITETTPVSPAKYNRSVLDAEASAAGFGRAGGTSVVLRFALLYGPRDAFSQQLISGARKGWLPLFGAPDGYFPMVTQDDAAAAVIAALDVPGGIYNVVDDEPLTRREIGGTLAGALGVRQPKLPPAWMAMLAGSLGETLARSLRISNAKLRMFGWMPGVPTVREGLRQAVDATTKA
jgi:2-alkyl-3-oxoalkanoate reductase